MSAVRNFKFERLVKNSMKHYVQFIKYTAGIHVLILLY